MILPLYLCVIALPSLHTHTRSSPPRFQLPGRAETAYRAHDMKRAIEAALEALYATNKYFQDAAPWALGTAPALVSDESVE
jgi:hypothetical protein